MNGNTFRNYRKQKNWSQEKFAKKLNDYLKAHGVKNAKYNDRTISQWENGERDPKDIQIAYHIAQFMGISLDELYGDEIAKFESIENNPQEFVEEVIHESEETINYNNDSEQLSEISYCAILGIYDYDTEKQCYLTKFINQYDGLVLNNATGQPVPAKAEDHWDSFTHPDKLESIIHDAERIGYISEDDYKEFLCKTYFDSDYEYFEDEIWSGSDLFAPLHIEGFTGCEFEIADMDYNNISTSAKYVNNDKHTIIVETHAELYITEQKYQQMLRRIYNTGILNSILAVTNNHYASTIDVNNRHFGNAMITLDHIAKLRKLFLEYDYFTK